MVMDALRGYVQLANGLTEVTKQRAQAAAKALIQQTGAEQLTTGLTTKVSDLAEEIVATSKSNRQLLQAIVANEVEGAVAKLGFVRAEEVSALARRIESLEKELAAAEKPAMSTPPIKQAPAAKKAAPAKEAAAKKAPAKKAAAKKTAAKKTTAKKA
ncbi:phasin family protein [Kribbella sp. NBC_01245]|uniref:phasin family protein n=1 Tax=Kribbella sp. NBC_01245 TaxID=2903578 RepID=UPI002E2A54A1|nr:phasin family protein [Kribbella sp. NBC_01245]